MFPLHQSPLYHIHCGHSAEELKVRPGLVAIFHASAKVARLKVLGFHEGGRGVVTRSILLSFG